MTNRIKAMHSEYGINLTAKCKTCCNLISYEQSRKWYKCKAFGVSSSETSDWRLYYQACGIYNIDFDNMNRKPLKDVLKHLSKSIYIEQLPGQIKLE